MTGNKKGGHHIEYIDRRGSGSVKWDGLKKYFGRPDVLALWVADMDFRAPECVSRAIEESARRDVYGYFFPPDGYFDAFIDWEYKRHGYKPERRWIVPSTGVVSTIYQLIHVLSAPGDGVIIFTPVYYPFMDAVRDTGRTLVTSSLVSDERGVYTFDFDDFEKKLAEHRPKILIFCSPHNPVGRVWRRDELERIVDACRKYGVYIISDEIHQDLVIGNNRHIPTVTVGGYSDRIITLTSASKTFNLAGLKNSITIIENPDIRRRHAEFCKKHGAPQPGYLDYVAVGAAYAEGEAWLSELLCLLRQNFDILKDALAPCHDAVLTPLEGTYLAWLDIGAYVAPDGIEKFILDRCGFAPDWGAWFFPGNNRLDTHIRINLATSQDNIRTAAESLARELSS